MDGKHFGDDGDDDDDEDDDGHYINKGVGQLRIILSPILPSILFIQ